MDEAQDVSDHARGVLRAYLAVGRSLRAEAAGGLDPAALAHPETGEIAGYFTYGQERSRIRQSDLPPNLAALTSVAVSLLRRRANLPPASIGTQTSLAGSPGHGPNHVDGLTMYRAASELSARLRDGRSHRCGDARSAVPCLSSLQAMATPGPPY